MLELRYAVVIPCRDEEAGIVRKIASTHCLRFPPLPAGLRHLAVVVDDHSEDGTLAQARAAVAALEERTDLEWRVVESGHPPGKGGALRTGFEEASGYDLLATTDVDAEVAPGAPIATAAAFSDPRVGAATGTQRYVLRDGAGGATADGSDLYDRASEAVRRLESSYGMLFSVHGPWLVLRAATGVLPAAGVGADDLDLALQVRAAGWRVVLVEEASFTEPKPAGERLAAQRIRRARAYFEAVDRHLPRALRIAPVPIGALQLALYAVAPPLLALAFLAAAAAPVVLTARSGGGPALVLAVLLAVGAVLVLPVFANGVSYALVILRARLAPRRRDADRWRPVAR